MKLSKSLGKPDVGLNLAISLAKITWETPGKMFYLLYWGKKPSPRSHCT